jgi:hypothetical protein
VWFLAPWLVMASPMTRDGVRYIYPALFPACLLAAAGLDWVASFAARLLRRPSAALVATSVLGAAVVLYTLLAGRTVHPYYLDYYNELAGGPEVVERRRSFEIAWWGEGMKEALDHVGRIAPRGARVMIFAHPTHVVSLRDDLERVDVFEQADYVVFNKLYNEAPRTDQHHVIHVVRAGGAPLVWVYERNRPAVRPGQAGEVRR